MNILLVGYDREKAVVSGIEQLLLGVIKSQSGWAQLTPGLYAVTSPLSAAQLRDNIVSIVGSTNRIVVYLVNDRYWATSGVPQDVNKWLQNNWNII